MANELTGPDHGDECECGLPRLEHGDAPFIPFGEECQAAELYRRVDSLVADAPPAFRGADITFCTAGWCGEMTEPDKSEAELLAEELVAACEERHGSLPLGPAACEACGREPDNHIGGPILHRATGDICEVGAWEDRARALLPDLATALVRSLSAVPGGYEMDSGSAVNPEDVELRLVIE